MLCIRENILLLEERIGKICLKTGRKREELVLIAVSKFQPVEKIIEAVESGIRNIGENRVQEAKDKFDRISGMFKEIKWHMIGTLQRNKVKYSVKIFDLIQSVDSVKLLEEIEKRAGNVGKKQDVLIEVKTSFENTKKGIEEGNIYELIGKIKESKFVRLKGLMTIAPFGIDARPYFRKLYNLAEKLRLEFRNEKNIGFDIISMGMTDDFEIAIEEGSNMIRIGRAIFGERAGG